MAPRYDAPRVTDHVYRACITEAITDLRPAGTVVDCGCGTGLGTAQLLGAERVHALDMSEQMLGELRRKIRSDKLQTARGDVRQLPYPDAMFDRVLVANVLQHLVVPADQQLAAAEILRVLKPGGRYCVSVHHFSLDKQMAGWKKESRGGESAPTVEYVFRYSRAELAALFPGARIRAIGFYGWPAQRLSSEPPDTP